MKSLRCLLPLLLLFCLTFLLSGCGAENRIQYRAAEDHAVVEACGEKVTEALILAEYKGLPVTEIGKYAFSHCSALTSVVIPDTVTAIGDSAFSHCSALTSVVIPGSVTSVGSYAFGDCDALTSVSLPDSLTALSPTAFRDSPVLETFRGTVGHGFAYCTLTEALEMELVSLEVAMKAIDHGTVYVTAGDSVSVLLDIPAGTYLASESGSVQNMLITESKTAAIGAGERESISLSTACMNLHRAIPTAENGFTAGYLGDEAALTRLAAVFSARDIDYPVKQAAVWILTDNASYGDTGTLMATDNSGIRRRLITEEDYAKAQALVEEVCGNNSAQ